MASWQLITTDLAGVQVGEVLNATDRQLVLPHMRVPTLQFKVPLWDATADTLLNTDCLVKAYRTDPVDNVRRLVFNGPVVSAEESGEALGQTIAIAAAGPMWRLAHRLVPSTLTKAGFGWGPTDLGAIAHLILDDVNGTSFSGVSKGSRTATGSGQVTYKEIKNAAQAITELTAGLTSFEYEVAPTEPTNVAGVDGWPQIGLMNIAPTIGTTRNDAVFEYGTNGANVASYNRQISRDGMLTRGVISLNGWPDGTTQDLRIRQDATARTNRGLFEDIVPDNGVIDDALRDALVDFHLSIRKNPRQILTFRPSTNALPTPFVQYSVGDTVRCRAEVRGTVRFDALFRVWGITISVDSNGNEETELELVMP